jgi:chromate transporter
LSCILARACDIAWTGVHDCTLIGFILGGIRGTVVSTVGIFLPAFLLVAVSGPLVPLIRKSKPANAFLDGVNAASLSLMAAVSRQLGQRLGWMLLPVSSPSRVLDRFVAIPSEFRLVTFGAIVGLIANTFHVSR